MLVLPTSNDPPAHVERLIVRNHVYALASEPHMKMRNVYLDIMRTALPKKRMTEEGTRQLRRGLCAGCNIRQILTIPIAYIARMTCGSRSWQHV